MAALGSMTICGVAMAPKPEVTSADARPNAASPWAPSELTLLAPEKGSKTEAIEIEKKRGKESNDERQGSLCSIM